MASHQTHDLTFTDGEVRKRYRGWERGEPDREWACLTLLAGHTDDVAPKPLRRETDPDGVPVVVMSRLPGDSLGDERLTSGQTNSLGRALRATYDVSLDAVLDAEIGERIYGPSKLPEVVSDWLHESPGVPRCQDRALVAQAIDSVLTWLATPGSLPAPHLSALGVSDRKPANTLWDGRTCRLIDFEDSGLSDPAFEIADHLEHIAWRLTNHLDSRQLVEAVGLTTEQCGRLERYRPLWAAFWLAMLLPGHGGSRRNPPGTAERQARHLLSLLE